MAKGGKKSGKKKGGKKKSSKLANMTEEERIAYEEQKALAEEELRKKKENMLTQFLKVKTTKLQHTKYNVSNMEKCFYLMQWMCYTDIKRVKK